MEAQELPDNSVSLEPGQPENEPEQGGPTWKRPAWKRTVLVVGGWAILAAGAAVIVTLAATHKSAVTENAIAYVNGYTNGFVDGYTNGLVDGIQACEIGPFDAHPINY